MVSLFAGAVERRLPTTVWIDIDPDATGSGRGWSSRGCTAATRTTQRLGVTTPRHAIAHPQQLEAGRSFACVAVAREPLLGPELRRTAIRYRPSGVRNVVNVSVSGAGDLVDRHVVDADERRGPSQEMLGRLHVRRTAGAAAEMLEIDRPLD